VPKQKTQKPKQPNQPVRRDCSVCTLKGRPRVFTEWHDPNIVIVGQAPGKTEAKEGRPFLGAAGKFGRKFLKAFETATITNSARCYPPEDRKPTAKEMKCCKPALLNVLAGAQEIYLLGRPAFDNLFPKKSFTQYVGSSFREDGKLWHILYHPAAALHNPRLRNRIIEDYKLAGESTEITQAMPIEVPVIRPDDQILKPDAKVIIADTEWDSKGNILVGAMDEEGRFYQEVL